MPTIRSTAPAATTVASATLTLTTPEAAAESTAPTIRAAVATRATQPSKATWAAAKHSTSIGTTATWASSALAGLGLRTEPARSGPAMAPCASPALAACSTRRIFAASPRGAALATITPLPTFTAAKPP